MTDRSTSRRFALRQQPSDGRQAVLRRRVLLFAVAAQLADAVTFVAAIGAGVPLVGEANPLARAIYPVAGSGGVVDLKLAGVAALVALLAFGERWRPNRVGSFRFVLVGAVIIGLVGTVGTIANMLAALSLA